MDLHGATALITGGAHRLGRAIALALADAGANVAFTYLSSPDAAAETVHAIETRGVRAFAVQADAAHDGDVMRAVDAVRERFPTIDVWVANAGVFRRTPLAQV